MSELKQPESSTRFTTSVNASSPRFERNRHSVTDLVARVRMDEEQIQQGGGEKAIESQHAKGRMTARERIAKLIDPGTTFFELGSYAAWGMESPTAHMSFEEMARDRFIIGDKVYVKEEIARWEEKLGVNHMIMRVQWPGLPQEQVLGSIRRLGEIYG